MQSMRFLVDTAVNPYFSFAAMVVPSNDFFIGNDSPTEYKLFNNGGSQLQISAITLKAHEIWDAGSEVYDPSAAAFVGNNGLRTPQNSVVAFNFAEFFGYNGLTTGAGYTFNSQLTANADVYRMRAIIGYSEQADLPATLARVVMIDTGGRFKSLILDRGSDEGIRVNDPVLSAEGLVGRVVLTTPSVSKVQLILDGDSSAGVHFERTRRQGVARGTGGNDLSIAFVPFTADVVPGDRVYTAGIDGVYPRGIFVGSVTSVEKGKDLFKTVRCAPATDFSSLEDLIVLRTPRIAPAATEFAP